MPYLRHVPELAKLVAGRTTFRPEEAAPLTTLSLQLQIHHFDTKFLVFNAQFLVFDTKFIIVI